MLSGKGLMVTYVLVVGLTELRFQKLGNNCSTSSLNPVASGSCTSGKKFKQWRFASSLAVFSLSSGLC